MRKVFVFSIAGLFAMLGVAYFAASQPTNDREPASVSVSQGIPKDLYRSAKY